jgi:hypothetical protein
MKTAALCFGVIAFALVGSPVLAQSKLTATGNLSGRIIDTAGQPVADVQVSVPLPGAAGRSITARTNSGGLYVLEKLPAPASYMITTAPTADKKYLAGGNRMAISIQRGPNRVADIILSARQSDQATYVGTKVCAECHQSFDKGRVAQHAASAHMRIVKYGQAEIIEPAGGWGGENDPAGKSTGLKSAPPDGSNGAPVELTMCQKNGVKGFAFGGEPGTACATGVFVPIAATAGGQGDRYIAPGTDVPVANVGKFKQHFYAWIRDLPASTRSYVGYPYVGSEKDMVMFPVLLAQSGDNSPRLTAFRAMRVGGMNNAWVDQGETYSRACVGCHVVGLKVDVTGDSNMFTSSFSFLETGVGCENCHGPGSEHVANPKKAKGIIQPRMLTAKAEREVCAKCHGLALPQSSQPKGAFAYPWNSAYKDKVGNGNFVAGIYELADFMPGWKDGKGYTSWDGRHGRHHKQQSFEFEFSKHAMSTSQPLTCTDCHASHSLYQGPDSKVVKDAAGVAYDFRGLRFRNNTICLSCHAGGKGFAQLTKDDVAGLNAGDGQPTFITGSAKPVYDPGTKDAAELSKIKTAGGQVARAVIKHMSEKAGMSKGVSYTPLDDARPVGRCDTCHMPKVGLMGGWTSAVKSDDKSMRAMVEGDTTSHVGDIVYPADVYGMYEASRKQRASTPTNLRSPAIPEAFNVMATSCSKCHEGARYYMK